MSLVWKSAQSIADHTEMKLPDDIMGKTKLQEEKEEKRKYKTMREKWSAFETFSLLIFSSPCYEMR